MEIATKGENSSPLTVHTNPTLAISFSHIAGKTIPPTAPPALAIPVATPKCLVKYVIITGAPAPKTRPIPTPVLTPCARTNCQYSLHHEVASVEATRRMLPPVKQCWKRPLSIWPLTTMDMKKRRKICREPIQAMVEGECVRKRTDS